MLNEDPSQQATVDAHRDWRRAHEGLTRLARCRARLDWDEGVALLDALRSGAHLHLGFGSFGEYIERILGYGRRSTEEKLRVAEALERLPELAKSLRDGTTSWSIVRELSRIASRDNERAWLDAVRGCTVRQVEGLVAGHRPGNGPDDPYDASAERHVLRFDVSAETLATFCEAMASLRRDADSSLDDDAALLLLARCALQGPNDEGRANYQVAFTVCEACGRGWQQGSGEAIEVHPDVLETAYCDAQHIGRIDPASVKRAHVGADRAQQDVPPAVRRLVLRRDGGRCVVPGCRQAVFVDVHHLVPRSEGGDHDPDALAVLCSAHHRAVHRGQLVIEGWVTNGLAFRHADGTAYGHVVQPCDVAIYEETFRALRGMGFRERETRRAIERVRASAQVGQTSVPAALRQALALLAPDRTPTATACIS